MRYFVVFEMIDENGQWVKSFESFISIASAMYWINRASENKEIRKIIGPLQLDV